MRHHFVFFTLISVLFSLSQTSPSSAHFFPNISSIPPWIQKNINQTAGAWDAFNKYAGCRAGDKVDGLARVKKYFQNFGYITESPLNFTDAFDDMLESAIKTYQKNFNLEPTGQLDNKTIQQILRPRCGNPDIVNGTTTMNSGHPESHNTSLFHSVAHYSFFPGRPRWPSNRRTLSYAFLPDNQLTDNVKAVFGRAFSRWSTVTQLNFTQSESYRTADIRIAFASGDHGDGEPFDGVLGTLAHAFSPPSGFFHLDNDENWVIEGVTNPLTTMSAVDLESVAVHEIGHLLGLGHSSVEESIMFPTISSGTRKVELASDDIEGIQTLYGSNPNFNGTTSPSVQQRDTSGAYSSGSLWGMSLLLAVGFVHIILL
ncbi:hypothetical protein Dsin_010244 [Dipteronia sinensis]|uniref:Peptidase metallopeptidase domain-containing protein n=1 Tax=Dipteronia sinensis TaxID=43782 RepID=A0AAE0ATC6_9ROSI|nr:hypothetical protein Dsin_010244 [Dipteronia sinensis]